jgi:biopolymer transport protein ExbD
MLLHKSCYCISPKKILNLATMNEKRQEISFFWMEIVIIISFCVLLIFMFSADTINNQNESLNLPTDSFLD